MFLQDGMDKYDGIIHFVTKHKLDWNIRIDRLAPTWDQPTDAEFHEFDGIIADGLATAEKQTLYARTKVPLVAIDWAEQRLCARRRNFVSINSDSAEIGRLAAKTLLEVGGFASYAFLPQPDNPWWSTDRGRAFTNAMAHRDIHAVEIDMSRPIGRQLRGLPKPAAVFAAHDTIAAYAIREAQREGIGIPVDMSVLGTDNERITCLHTNPQLATIQPDFEKAGYLAAYVLEKMLNGEPVARKHKYHVKTVVMRKSLEPSGSAGRLVQRAMELIHDHAEKYGSISSLASDLGISRRLLDRRFRQIAGKSVLNEIHETMLGKVCSLLRSTELSVSEICRSCAMGSGTYPLRLFKKKTGMTMRTYRESFRSDQLPGQHF